jgi:hypothetical protein
VHAAAHHMVVCMPTDACMHAFSVHVCVDGRVCVCVCVCVCA